MEQSQQRADYEKALRGQTDELLKRTETIAALHQQLAAKSDEVASLAKQGLHTTTGGNSLCFLHLGERLSAKGPLVSILHRGEYPLYELWVNIIDLDRRSALPRQEMTFENLFSTDIRFNAGTVPIKTAVTLGRLPL